MTLRSAFVAASSLAAGTLLPVSAHADITYAINPFPGAPAISGQITTDGTLGPLSAANIVSWSYTISGRTFTGGGTETFFYLSQPVATATDLALGVGGTTGTFGLQRIVDGFVNNELLWSWSAATPSLPFDLAFASHRNYDRNPPAFNANFQSSSPLIFAYVPTPSAATLLGLSGLLATRRRRR